MEKFSELLQKALIGVFVSLLLVMLYGHFKGYDLSISWNVTTTADSKDFSAHAFQKGPFEFSFTGKKYSLAENFSAGPIERNFTQDAFFLTIICFGLCIILAVSTYLSRYWFIGIMALFIFFIINLHLPETGLFGFSSRSSAGIIILLAAYLLPAYVFHAFFSGSTFAIRLLCFLVISVLIVVFAGINLIDVQEQLIAGSYFGLIILTLLFLFIVAEENVYAILYLVTRSRGAKNNHVHFSVFSIIYLGLIGVYYGKKSGMLDIEVAYFNPYILLGISSLITLWGLKYKKEIFQYLLSLEMARTFFSGVGIVVFGFLGLAFFRGNDPVYEGLHYFIVYAHLGFGVMFFLYIIINFINPLSEGLQVYKIAYREQNFPYASAKLAGIAAVAAFFFLASKEPFLLFRAGHFNYLGAQAEINNQLDLAQEYYREGSIYGHDNHFSNYKLAYRHLQKQNIDEANYRFGRATLRYPSPQSFVNHAGTFAMQGETTPSIVTLKSGLRMFPENNQILNNLGLIYTDLGDLQQAEDYFEQSSEDTEWTNASLVNHWKVKSGFNENELQNDYAKGNLAVKTNILDFLLERKSKPAISFDTATIFPSYPLHRTAFLINSAWYFTDQAIYNELSNSLTGTIEENMHNTAVHAISLNQYLSGEVNMAVRSLDQLQAHAPQSEQARYLNELGLITLEQHALPIALDYFEKALQSGSDAAFLNKAAALMESGNYSEAIEWAEHLVTIDSSFRALLNDLTAIKSRENLDLNQRLYRLYYFYPEYSLAEVSALTEQADTTYLTTLWYKIQKELLKNSEHKAVQDYMSILKSRLSRKHFLEAELLIGLANNQLVKNDHPVSHILQLQDSSQMATALAGEANKNAFNTPIVLAAADVLKNYDIQLAYDVLVEAVAINRQNPDIYKEYVLTALEAGLFGYASGALPKLRSLLSAEEYSDFHQEYLRKKAEIEEQSW